MALVSKIHRYVEDYGSKGYDIIIVGSPKHPEVCGIKGWADEKCHVTIINSPEDAENYMKNSTKKLCIVSQTTFNYNKFQDIVEIIAKKGYDITVLNTICNATEVRQTEARKVAQCSDVMIATGTAPIHRSYLKYVKTNAKILTIYRQVTKWIIHKSGPTIT